MEAPSELKEVLAENHTVRLIEEGIYSVLPDTARQHHYDKRATVYDLVVSTRLYNAVMWGSSPLDYVAFARRAVTSSVDGKFLDAGCGSMLFTARSYLKCHRQIIAFDQSLAMLRRARKRLINLSGSVPENILLLQADLNDLPFRADAFRTALCLNVLHQFEDAAALIPKLKSLLTGGGHLYLTSLVSNDRFIGDRFLKALHATGEFVRPRSKLELKEMLDRSLGQKVSYRIKGNMAYATTAQSSFNSAG
jgi:ubiquinone/menaquinone biosynthesis C-methylase UbiE